MKNGEGKRKLVKRCAGVAAFWLILALVLGRMYGILSWKDTGGGYYTQVETFYGLEEDVVDVLFLGSSHCYCSVINSKLWDDYGIAAYSFSISGQDMVSSYYWLREALKTQKPKVVCLEMYYVTCRGYAVEGNLYRNILPYHISADYLKLVRDMIDEEAESPQTERGIVSEEDRAGFLAKWPVVHTRYKELQRQDFTGPDILYLGYSVSAESLNSQPVAWARDGGELYTGDETAGIEDEKWLRRIIGLAKENGVEICLFLAPMSVTVQQQKQMNYVEELAEEEGIPFLNFVDLRDQIRFDAEQDFEDWGHVNYRGAEKVTAALGKFLSQNYTLENHSGDERYELWERDSATRNHELDAYKLQAGEDLQYILDHAAYVTDYTVIITADGDYYRETDYLGDLLEPLGIAEEFAGGGGIWIVEDGQVTWKAAADTGDWYLERDGVDMALFRENGVSRIFVNQSEYGVKAQDGINIIFFDKLLNQVVCVAGFAPSEGGYGRVR